MNCAFDSQHVNITQFVLLFTTITFRYASSSACTCNITKKIFVTFYVVWGVFHTLHSVWTSKSTIISSCFRVIWAHGWPFPGRQKHFFQILFNQDTLVYRVCVSIHCLVLSTFWKREKYVCSFFYHTTGNCTLNLALTWHGKSYSKCYSNDVVGKKKTFRRSEAHGYGQFLFGRNYRLSQTVWQLFRVFLLWDLCEDKRIWVPPVAAERDISKDVCRRQRRRTSLLICVKSTKETPCAGRPKPKNRLRYQNIRE